MFVPQNLRVDGVRGDVGAHTFGGTSYRFDEAALGAGQTRTYVFSVVAVAPGPRVFVTVEAGSRSPEAFIRDNSARGPVRVRVRVRVR